MQGVDDSNSHENKSNENGVLLFMAKRKRIRKTIRMVLREAKRERDLKEHLQQLKTDRQKDNIE